MSFTLAIIILTALISVGAFSNEPLLYKLILWPKRMDNPNEYYRLLTSGFIHADWQHLVFNMLTLYFFGSMVEEFLYADKHYLFVVLYLSGIVASSLPSFVKNRNNSYYRSLGASGGVAAILFASIYFNPWEPIRFLFIPFNIPGVFFALGYLAYSAYMDKKGGSNIAHDAHLWGAVYGFLFALLFNLSHIQEFIQTITHPQFR